MKDLRHPAESFYKRDSDLDETLVSEDDSEVEDYHRDATPLRDVPNGSSSHWIRTE